MLVSDFHYDLPEELIAQEPLADRANSRMLRLEAASGRLNDGQFRDFPEALRPDDLVVFNNTRVFPARLYGRRSGVRAQAVSLRNPAARDFLQGRVEVLLTRQVSEEPNEWECLVRPGRKIGVGENLFFGDNDELHAEVVERGGFGERRIRFEISEKSENAHPIPAKNAGIRVGQPSRDSFFALVEEVGHVPLPPYIGRTDGANDRERYQTVYARERGSVAAPTAGLHFTAEILERIRERGIETTEITLHVGLGTFQPVRAERVEEHRLHSEAYSISEEAAEKITRAKSLGRRVVAVGTTTVRTLEYAIQSQNPHPISQSTRDKGGATSSAPSSSLELRAGSGEANLFIYPGYEFRIVGALLTNFHLPQSTLLMLVCALGGKNNVMRGYAHAVEERYRFYSYGDCMFVE